ncbi:Anp1-domain-containing protein [Microdochium trichocladiopsis]|uniref:Anp1-domain-containing protein n=1 Tax=Microdochium trichocladiopsis TaxID=1682393 RepID=A0A9P8YJJ3_9PEZI|nr:Anp1-domain-containing protein [Microdochium trichocladiopsis]KAH7041450.1 Anp1-domain-containing protein [Microdochium trichocladiopsis]
MFARPSGPWANLCLLAVFVLTIIFSISSLVYERQGQPFSCRTWGECGYLERPTYKHDIPGDLDVVVDQGKSHDDTTLYTREILNLPHPNLLILVVSKDSASWGADSRSSGRTPTDLIDLLIRTDLDFTSVSIGLLTTQRDEFDSIKNATRALPFARTSILLQPASSSSRPDDDDSETTHRANIARARNYLMLRTVQDETHLLWIDADIVELSEGLVQRMMDQANKNPHVGLMTARCRLRDADSDYDTKAWSLSAHAGGSDGSNDNDNQRAGEKAAAERAKMITGAVPLSDQASAAQELRDTRTQAGQLLAGTADDALVPLDSVGATILYIRSDLVLRGVIFPPFNVVGTLWDHGGWTGMETEGICYMARQIAGKGCYLLGGQNYVRHADLGSSVS